MVPDPLFAHAIQLRVLGVDAIDPAADTPWLFARFAALLSESCTLAWVQNGGLCNSLQAKVNAATAASGRGDSGAAANELRALTNELDAQRGKQLSEAGYSLLRLNADYILRKFS
jgi:hypothetical protein